MLADTYDVLDIIARTIFLNTCCHSTQPRCVNTTDLLVYAMTVTPPPERQRSPKVRRALFLQTMLRPDVAEEY